jgi:hypothetical protein
MGDVLAIRRATRTMRVRVDKRYARIRGGE